MEQWLPNRLSLVDSKRQKIYNTRPALKYMSTFFRSEPMCVCDQVFPKAMKGFKSRGEESWKLAQGYSTKVPLVRFPIACDVRGNRGSPSLLLPFKDIQRTYCWPIENAKITMLTFFQQNPL